MAYNQANGYNVSVASGVIDITGDTAEFTFYGHSGNVTSTISIVGDTGDLDFLGVNAIVGLTGVISIIGDTANVNFTGTDGDASLSGTINIIGDTASFSFTGLIANIGQGKSKILGTVTIDYLPSSVNITFK